MISAIRHGAAATGSKLATQATASVLEHATPRAQQLFADTGVIGLVQGAEGLQLLRTPPAAEARRAEHLLLTGRVSPRDPIVGAGTSGPVGTAMIGPVGDASLPATIKQVGAREEHLGYLGAKQMGVPHLTTATVLRDGSAVSELLPGATFRHHGVNDAVDLHRMLTGGVLRAEPGLSRAEAAAAARIELQLLQAFDYIFAIFDRHGGNGIAEPAKSLARYIDHGFMFFGQRVEAPLVPSLRGGYLLGAGVSGTIHLDDAAMAVLRARLDPERLASLFAEAGVTLPQHVEGAQARLAHLLETGSFSYVANDTAAVAN